MAFSRPSRRQAPNRAVERFNFKPNWSPKLECDQKCGTVAYSMTLQMLHGGADPRPLESREDLIKTLLGVGVDLLLRSISAERAAEIEGKVDRVFRLFERTPSRANSLLLQRELDELNQLVQNHEKVKRERRLTHHQTGRFTGH